MNSPNRFRIERDQKIGSELVFESVIPHDWDETLMIAVTQYFHSIRDNVGAMSDHTKQDRCHMRHSHQNHSLSPIPIGHPLLPILLLTEQLLKDGYLVKCHSLDFLNNVNLSTATRAKK
jgi:hypothetical protein